jgi:hypothetical protein
MDMPSENKRETDGIYLLEYENIGPVLIQDFPDDSFVKATLDVSDVTKKSLEKYLLNY